MQRPRTTLQRCFSPARLKEADSVAGIRLSSRRLARRANRARQLVLGSIILAIGYSPALADDATLERIRSGYVQSVTSWRAVWTRCQQKKTYSDQMRSDPRFAEKVKQGARGALVDWAVDGEMFHVSYRRPGGESVSWFSYDGKTTWTLDYTDDGEIKRVRKRRLETKTDAGLTRNVNPGRFLGLYFNVGPTLGRGVALKSLLKTEPLTLVGQEEAEGASCWNVEFAYPSTDANVSLPVRVWFDPAHGYLPRRTTLECNGQMVGTSRVVRFREISSGDQVVSFPSEMVEEHPLETRRLTLLEIKLDDDVPDDLFRPPLPRGIPVYDLDDERSADQLQAELEKPARERLQAKMQAQAAARKEAKPPPPVSEDRSRKIDAAVPPNRVALWVLIATGLVVLGMVTLHSLRRS